jgi:hypothetical protein
MYDTLLGNLMMGSSSAQMLIICHERCSKQVHKSQFYSSNENHDMLSGGFSQCKERREERKERERREKGERKAKREELVAPVQYYWMMDLARCFPSSAPRPQLALCSARRACHPPRFKPHSRPNWSCDQCNNDICPRSPSIYLTFTTHALIEP